MSLQGMGPQESLDAVFFRVLRCPKCEAPLESSGNDSMCSVCKRVYPVIRGIPVFSLPGDRNGFYDIEAAFHDEKFGSLTAEDIDRERASFSYEFRSVRNRFDLCAGSLVLEVGCGVHADGTELAQGGVYVVESDISLTAVEKSKELCQRLGLEDVTRFIVCSGDEPPFAEDSFDACITVGSFHHMPDPLRCLKALRRCTRKGGLVVLTVEPNSWPYYVLGPAMKVARIISRKLNPRRFNSVADDNTFGFSRGQLERLAHQAGLKVASMDRISYTLQLYQLLFIAGQKFFRLKSYPNKELVEKLFVLDQKLARLPVFRFFNWYWNCVFLRDS